MVYTISKISIVTLAIYFILYIITHIMIGVYYNRAKKESELLPDDLDEKANVKKWSFIFKWFPAMYIIFLLIVFNL